MAEEEKRYKEPQDFNYPKELGYIKEHQWLKKEDDSRGRVGITDYAQYEMTEIVYIEIAPVGTEVKAHEPFASIESKKAVSDVCAPVNGKIVEVNDEVLDMPNTINEDSYGRGWFIVIEMSDPAEVDSLWSGEQYLNFLLGKE